MTGQLLAGMLGTLMASAGLGTGRQHQGLACVRRQACLLAARLLQSTTLGLASAGAGRRLVSGSGFRRWDLLLPGQLGDHASPWSHINPLHLPPCITLVTHLASSLPFLNVLDDAGGIL
jgi:hypothetical protein